jgi:hypothetical protein
VHTKIDTSGIKGTFIDDPRLEEYGQAVNTSLVLEGARSVDFKFSTDLYGLGDSPADGVQAIATPMTELVRKSLGGGLLSYSTTLTGGSSIAPIVDDVTGIVAGMIFWAQDTTAPTPGNTGRVWGAQVKSVDADTSVVQLCEALPFKPATGDPVYGGFTGYIVENTVESAIAAGHTMSWLVQLHPTDPNFVWQVMGAMHSFSISGLERNQAPQLDFTVAGANYKYSDADGLANVTPEDPPFGPSPLAVHSLKCSIAPSAGTASGYTSVSSFAAELGVMSDPVDTITEQTHLMQGRHDYTVKFDNSGVTVVIPEMTSAWYAAQKAGTTFRITLTQGSKGPGKVWTLIYPKCQIVETPAKTDVGEAMGVQIKFRAMINDTVPESTNEDLRISRFVFGFA